MLKNTLSWAIEMNYSVFPLCDDQLPGDQAAEDDQPAQVQPGQPRHTRRPDHRHPEPVRGRAREPTQDGKWAQSNNF